MDMRCCEICGTPYNRHALKECPFTESRHLVLRFRNRATGVSGLNYYAVGTDGERELAQKHSFLNAAALVQWYERGRIVHEHYEPYPDL